MPTLSLRPPWSSVSPDISEPAQHIYESRWSIKKAKVSKRTAATPANAN